MTRARRPVRAGLWDRGDCAAVAALVGAWGLAVAFLTMGRVPLGTPARVDRARVARVTDRIDPNTAPAASLRRLPLIGAVKAEAIVRFRRAARAAGGDRAFRFREDLMKVPGVGRATVERAGKWLALPPAPATTAPT